MRIFCFNKESAISWNSCALKSELVKSNRHKDAEKVERAAVHGGWPEWRLDDDLKPIGLGYVLKLPVFENEFIFLFIISFSTPCPLLYSSYFKYSLSASLFLLSRNPS